jgi:hypothetical protein
MRTLLLIAGILLSALGYFAFHSTKDPLLLQGGLTLGGGFVICAVFAVKAKWHGIAGAGILAFLGLLRTLPGATSREPFMMAAGAICLVVLFAVIRVLRAERLRRSIEKLKAGDA